ncbi:hypothetical protein V7139_16720 [Neobacillus drentensis]
MEEKQVELNYIIRQIKEKQPDIKSVFFVGCGASKAELYPANYFLEGNAKQTTSYKSTYSKRI